MQKVIFLNRDGHLEPDISQDSAGPLKVCLPGWHESLEDFIRVFKNSGEAALDPDSEVPADNVIRPRIRQWSGDVFKEALMRLITNPAHKQLNLFQETVEPLYENRLGLDLFVVLFRAVLDGMPDISRATEEQRWKLFLEIAVRCLHATATSLDAFNNLKISV